MNSSLKAPFPYFGGKSKIAPEVWRRFGKVQNYVEPFFGSGAILLSSPYVGHTETVNDADALLANFFRALQHAPTDVTQYADYPVSELDLHARHGWLVNKRGFVEEMLADPDWYDAKVAGWWVWGISQWIGSGWCQQKSANVRQLPHVGNAGRGVHRAPPKQIPMLKPGANGVPVDVVSSPALISEMGNLPVQIPHLGDEGRGMHRPAHTHALLDYFNALAVRLRRVRVTCGDFERVLGPSVTWRHGVTAVFLDPPYDLSTRASVYAVETDAAHRAREWAIANGDNPLLRIAYCGYRLNEGDDRFPETWSRFNWKAAGGYGSQGKGRGRENAAREIVWFSPHCLNETPLEAWAREQDGAVA